MTIETRTVKFLERYISSENIVCSCFARFATAQLNGLRRAFAANMPIYFVKILFLYFCCTYAAHVVSNSYAAHYVANKDEYISVNPLI